MEVLLPCKDINYTTTVLPKGERSIRTVGRLSTNNSLVVVSTRTYWSLNRCEVGNVVRARNESLFTRLTLTDEMMMRVTHSSSWLPIYFLDERCWLFPTMSCNSQSVITLLHSFVLIDNDDRTKTTQAQHSGSFRIIIVVRVDESSCCISL